jgi:hypothetical protein
MLSNESREGNIKKNPELSEFVTLSYCLLPWQCKLMKLPYAAEY